MTWLWELLAEWFIWRWAERRSEDHPDDPQKPGEPTEPRKQIEEGK